MAALIMLVSLASGGCGGDSASLTSSPPSGVLVYSASAPDGYADIYTVGTDGTGIRNLTRRPYEDFDPAWSPTGDAIVFVRQRVSASDDLFVMDADGSNARALTVTPDTDESEPVWSRDWIYYVAGHDGIWRTPAEGGKAERVVRHGGGVSGPAVSPDGSQLAFARDLSGNGDWDIHVVPTAGGDERRVTDHDDIELEPTWTPDGKEIAFERRSISKTVVLRMGTDRRSVQLVSRLGNGGRLDDGEPSYSPDAAWLATLTIFDPTTRRSAIYLARADGTDARSVVDIKGLAYTGPDWRPMP